MSLDDELLAGCAVLDREGLTTAFGHLSARTPDGSVQIVNAGVAGQRAGEAPIHNAILAARRDIACVCRFHGPACLAWGARSVPLPAVIGLGMFCGQSVPVHLTASTITTPEAGEALARTLGDGLAVLLRGFGAVTVGATVAEAVVRAWTLEQNARAALDAGPIDLPQFTFTPDPGQIARAWHYLKERSR